MTGLNPFNIANTLSNEELFNQKLSKANRIVSQIKEQIEAAKEGDDFFYYCYRRPIQDALLIFTTDTFPQRFSLPVEDSFLETIHFKFPGLSREDSCAIGVKSKAILSIWDSYTKQAELDEKYSTASREHALSIDIRKLLAIQLKYLCEEFLKCSSANAA